MFSWNYIIFISWREKNIKNDKVHQISLKFEKKTTTRKLASIDEKKPMIFILGRG